MTAAKDFYYVAAGFGAIATAVAALAAFTVDQPIWRAGAFALVFVFLAATVSFVAWAIRSRSASRRGTRRVTRTFAIPVGDSREVGIALRRGQVLSGTIVADGTVDYWLVDDDNLDKHDRGRPFEPDDSAEGVFEGTVNFVADASATWHVVIDASRDEEDDEEDTVQVELDVTVAG